MQRPCLYQDISQLDISAYTHIYFSFGVLSPSYVVQIPNATATYEFNQFKQIQGAKRILSIGGWAFSTDPSTYMIFREGVTAANRLTMATNIANFIKDNDLDGVNIDWEYPGVRTMITCTSPVSLSRFANSPIRSFCYRHRIFPVSLLLVLMTVTITSLSLWF